MMAAGVCLCSQHSIWKFLIICGLLLGITGLSDLEPRYSVAENSVNYDEDAQFTDVQVSLLHPHARQRRQAVNPAPPPVDSSSPSNNTSTSSPGDSGGAVVAKSNTTTVTTTTPSGGAGAPGSSTTTAGGAGGGDSTTPTPSSSTTTNPFKNFTLEQDTHMYYTTQVYSGTDADGLWIDLDKMAAAKGETKKTPDALSDSHRTASSVTMSFKFMFYGHELERVTVATGGFLYMSNFLHQWLTATQYVAPLMANFDTQVGNNSKIHYVDNGTTFVVHWEDVHLQDQLQAGKFNFQTHLWDDGRVFLVYKEIPIPVDTIDNTRHPVKVGLSDAYYVDKTVSPDVRRRTIYEYHRVNVELERITNHTAVLIQPLPTCIQQKSCNACLSQVQKFECQWCPKLARCSDSLDRHRQDWLTNQCHQKEYQAARDLCHYYDTNQHLKKNATLAPTIPTPTAPNCTGRLCILEIGFQTHAPLPSIRPPAQHRKSSKDFRTANASIGDNRSTTQKFKSQETPRGGPGVGGIIAIIIILTLVIGLAVWFTYAYTHPNSSSGIWLIEHRPSNLKDKLNKVQFWKRGDGGEKYEVSMHPDGESVA